MIEPLLVKSSLIICICTYKRQNLLRLLLDDIRSQSIDCKQIVIVDGDPASGEVLALLGSFSSNQFSQIMYVPSNHGNLSYQRYLGWRVAIEQSPKVLLYFDDDLRLPRKDTIERLMKPFSWENQNIVGVTADTLGGEVEKFNGAEILQDMKRNRLKTNSWFIRAFGNSCGLGSGEMTPTGERIPPQRNATGYGKVTWLQGRVMAYKIDALTQNVFSDDMFALDHIRCGLGEDTFLSHRVATSGNMVFLFDSGILHPDDDLPKSYPYQARKYGYAYAYSRRLLNNYSKGYVTPGLVERIALIKTYIGHNILNLIKLVSNPRMYRLNYAWGYFLGSLRGLVQNPTAKNLTPNIDWWKDADLALSGVQKKIPVNQI